jgi:hypothetical protein
MKRFVAISMFALLTVSGVAHSKTVMVMEFVGHVTAIIPGDGQDPIAIAPGSSFSGIVRFDPELQDQDPFSDRFGEYGPPLRPGHVTVESGHPAVPNYLAVFSGSRGRIDVLNDVNGDWFEVTVGGFFENCNGITGPPFNGRELCEFMLQLRDEDGLVFDSDALPLSAPDLELMESATLSLEFREREFPTARIVGIIDSISIFPTVPEPGTLGLLGLGLLGLGVTRRRAANLAS